jgi:hypothetical protein
MPLQFNEKVVEETIKKELKVIECNQVSLVSHTDDLLDILIQAMLKE